MGGVVITRGEYTSTGDTYLYLQPSSQSLQGSCGRELATLRISLLHWVIIASKIRLRREGKAKTVNP